MNKIYPSLRQFFGPNFHMDCLLDFANPNEIINDYLVNSCKSTIDNVCAEIKELLKRKFSDDELDKIIFLDLGCYFDYRVHGFKSKEWLQWVLDQLQTGRHLAMDD